MLDINGWTFDVEDDWILYHFVMDVAEGRMNDVAKIAEALLAMSKPIEYPPDLL